MIKERMCGGCSCRKPKNELLRIVRTPSGTVIVDKTHNADGRGAYICKSEKCLNIAIKKKWFVRCLKSDISEELMEQIKSYVNSGE